MSPKKPLHAPHEWIAGIVAELCRIFVLPHAELLRWVMERCDAVDPPVEARLRQPHEGIPEEVIRKSFPDEARLAVRLREWLDDSTCACVRSDLPTRRRRRTKATRDREREFAAEVRAKIYSLISLFTPARPLTKAQFTRFGDVPKTSIDVRTLR
ncbi:MAG: hypothetical protein JXP34_18765, partial [Planctomycetes bacterium]|nr:hypothetical protein [Planctomycetota bacterium]